MRLGSFFTFPWLCNLAAELTLSGQHVVLCAPPTPALDSPPATKHSSKDQGLSRAASRPAWSLIFRSNHAVCRLNSSFSPCTFTLEMLAAGFAQHVADDSYSLSFFTPISRAQPLWVKQDPRDTHALLAPVIEGSKSDTDLAEMGWRQALSAPPTPHIHGLEDTPCLHPASA